jgi:uncharacterized membrane protein HdeD (DUF308 family)
MIVKPPGRAQPAKWIKLSLNVFMAISYLGIGLFLVFSPAASQVISTDYKKFVGAALILYGAFRGFRAYLQFKNPRIF